MKSVEYLRRGRQVTAEMNQDGRGVLALQGRIWRSLAEGRGGVTKHRHVLDHVYDTARATACVRKQAGRRVRLPLHLNALDETRTLERG